MIDEQLFWILMEIFVWVAFIGFAFLRAYIKRISVALRPENCDKCTGILKEKSVKKVWYKGIEFNILSYRYTYKINCAEYELAFERRLSAQENEDFDKYELPETIEILYNANYPKKAYSCDVETGYNPLQNKVFIVVLDISIVFAIISAIYCISELIGL